MSLIELILSRKEVVISLVFVGLIILVACAVIVGPAVRRSMKKRAAQRKAREAAKELQKKQEAAKRKAQQRRKRQLEPAPEVAPHADEQLVAAVAEAPSTQVAVDVPTATPPQEQTEETPETDSASDMQDILSSVFMDDEADSRHAVLMRDVEVPNAEELLEFARKIASELGGVS